MTQKRLSTIGGVIIAVVAFMAGYWPEHKRYLNATADLQLSEKQLTDARCRQRIYRLENMLLQALDRAAHSEFKEAREQATDFFLEARADMARPDMTAFKSDLNEIIGQDDAIRTALEKGDQSSRELMRQVMRQLASMAGPPPAASDPPAIIGVSQPPQT